MNKSIIIINNLIVKNELLCKTRSVYNYNDTTSSIVYSDYNDQSIFSISFKIKTRPLHRPKNNLSG